MNIERFCLVLGLAIVSLVGTEGLDNAISEDITAENPKCTGQDKAKAMYGGPDYIPTLKRNPATKAFTTVKGILVQPLRDYGRGGIYQATTFGVKDDTRKSGSGGYFGVQWITTKRDKLLFSVWDKRETIDRLALPMEPQLPDRYHCKRNCNDCGSKQPKGTSTGTQCKFSLLKRLEENDELKLTIEREEVQSVEYEDKTHYGHVWKVSVRYASGPNNETFMKDQFDLTKDEAFTLGRILFTEKELEIGSVSSGGIIRLGMFHEHIGCIRCGSFDFEVERSGPYIQKAVDPSKVPKIEEGFAKVGSIRGGATCKAFDIKSNEFGKLIFQTGPEYTPHWDVENQPRTRMYGTENGETFVREDKCEADGRSVCKNGGFCLIDGEGLVTCMCPKEFEGQHCEINAVEEIEANTQEIDMARVFRDTEEMGMAQYAEDTARDI